MPVIPMWAPFALLAAARSLVALHRQRHAELLSSSIGSGGASGKGESVQPKPPSVSDRSDVAAFQPAHIERDYLERTIETVRNHRDADNCWPQWANIFADEIERLWAENERLRERLRPIKPMEGDAV